MGRHRQLRSLPPAARLANSLKIGANPQPCSMEAPRIARLPRTLSAVGVIVDSPMSGPDRQALRPGRDQPRLQGILRRSPAPSDLPIYRNAAAPILLTRYPTGGLAKDTPVSDSSGTAGIRTP